MCFRFNLVQIQTSMDECLISIDHLCDFVSTFNHVKNKVFHVLLFPSFFFISNYIDLKSLFTHKPCWPVCVMSLNRFCSAHHHLLHSPHSLGYFSSCHPVVFHQKLKCQRLLSTCLIVPLENSVSFRQETVCLVWMLAKRANGANVSLLPACHLDEGHADEQRQGV